MTKCMTQLLQYQIFWSFLAQTSKQQCTVQSMLHQCMTQVLQHAIFPRAGLVQTGIQHCSVPTCHSGTAAFDLPFLHAGGSDVLVHALSADPLAALSALACMAEHHPGAVWESLVQLSGKCKRNLGSPVYYLASRFSTPSLLSFLSHRKRTAVSASGPDFACF